MNIKSASRIEPLDMFEPARKRDPPRSRFRDDAPILRSGERPREINERHAEPLRSCSHTAMRVIGNDGDDFRI